MKPFIVTITGPTCSGKSTLEAKLVADRGWSRVTSTTTREMRFGEINGREYLFVTPSEFSTIETLGDLVESIKFGGESYGITYGEIMRAARASDKPIVIVCDPVGAMQVRDYCELQNWDHMSAFMESSPKLISQRFLTRFVSDLEGMKNRTGVTERYAARLTEILSTESSWNKSELYYLAHVIKNFSETNEESVMNELAARVLLVRNGHTQPA